MLEQRPRVVAPGGRLVYATCSSEPEENEAVVRRLPRRASATSRRRSRTGRVRDALALTSTLPTDARPSADAAVPAHGLEAFFARSMLA